jgi:hypothetical protein
MLLLSKDAVGGLLALVNVPAVYPWTDELDLAFEEAEPATKIPNGVYHGDLSSFYAGTLCGKIRDMRSC